MYIPDLTPIEPEPNVVAVGWLDEEHPFPRGEVGRDVLDRLFAFCAHPIQRTRGFHPSPFTRRQRMGLPVWRGFRRLVLGSAEIRVPGPMRSYRAPDLIFHYVRDVHYLPPQEFLDALLAAPPPG